MILLLVYLGGTEVRVVCPLFTCVRARPLLVVPAIYVGDGDYVVVPYTRGRHRTSNQLVKMVYSEGYFPIIVYLVSSNLSVINKYSVRNVLNNDGLCFDLFVLIPIIIILSDTNK